MKKKSSSINTEKNSLSRRKSKNESEGRDFLCDICHKSYLSNPALYTHKKLKHEKNKQPSKGRGRPKKDQNEDIIEKNRYNPINITFFAKKERTGKTSSKDIDMCIDKAFIELYSADNIKRNQSRMIKSYKSIEDHPFLDIFKKDKHDIYKTVININEIIDKIFIDYLNKMSRFCNPDYYAVLIEFVTLFREYLNIINKNLDNNEDNIEYTKIKDGQEIPNFSNSFINQFLFPKGYDNDFSFSKDEAIDLVQNICYWLYDNNYTPYIISLKNGGVKQI